MGSHYTSHQHAGQHATRGRSSHVPGEQSQSGRRDSESTIYTSTCDGDSVETQSLTPAAEIVSTGNHDDSDSDSDADSTDNTLSSNESTHERPVSWTSMPNKGQLAILTFARLSEPLTQTSLQSYMFYQLQSYDPSLPSSTISTQAGILQGSFTAAQFLTAVWWGRLADAEWMGRKRVMLIGLCGTCISCLGFAFSRSFTAAVVFRVIGGVLNSNVGVLRTMIAEIVKEKEYQSRAFLLLPMCFNVGVIVGPILGGSLADPMKTYPRLFGPGSVFGGEGGVFWMRKWPFALPNVFNAIVIFMAMLAVLFGLEETHEIARYRSDLGLKVGKAIQRAVKRRFIPKHYRLLINHNDDESVFDDESVTNSSAPNIPARHRGRQVKRPGFRQIWTRNVILTLVINFLLAFHTSAFNSMTFTFLPTPRAPEGNGGGTFHFGGGLGLDSSQVGLATAIIGVIGLPLQIFVYPHIQSRLGTLTSFRTFLPFSSLSYALMPFVLVIPRLPYLVWPSFAIIVSLQVISRTFALPAGIILINNCITNPLVLGTVHGVAQSITSAARTLGPLVGGWGLGLGLKYDNVGGVWWGLAVQSLLGWALLWTIYEGRGIETEDVENEE